MRFTVGNVIPHKTNCYTIVAHGYYGDMDEPFNWNQTYQEEDQVLADAVMLTKLYEHNNGHGFIETNREMEAWLTPLGFKPSKIPTDSCSWEMLPWLDELVVAFHDENGVQHELEVLGFEEEKEVLVG